MSTHSDEEVRASCPFADSRPDGCICIALREPKRVSVDYQARFCLTNRHVQCRRFQRAVPEIPAADSAVSRSRSFDSRTFLVAGVVAALILVVATAFTFQGTWSGWFSNGPASTVASKASTAATVQPTAIVLGSVPTATEVATSTAEPSSIPVLAVTPTTVPTAVVVAPTPIPTATAVVTASPSPTVVPTATPSSTAISVTVTPNPTPSPTMTTPTQVVVETRATPDTHVVTSGETLSSIGSSYGVSPALIAAANNLTNVDLLDVGTSLFIPTPDGHLPSGSPNLGVHIVQAGDTLSSIATSFGVTIQNVIAANGISDPSHIEVGQIITIPRGDVVAPTPTPAPQVTYTVQAGDTLYSISKKYGVTIESIMAANGLTDRTYVFTGQVLIIPSG